MGSPLLKLPGLTGLCTEPCQFSHNPSNNGIPWRLHSVPRDSKDGDLTQRSPKTESLRGGSKHWLSPRGVGEFALSKAESSSSSPFEVGPTSSIRMGTGVGQMVRLATLPPPAQMPHACPRGVPVAWISILGIPRRSSGFEFGKLGSISHLSSFLGKPSPPLNLNRLICETGASSLVEGVEVWPNGSQ